MVKAVASATDLDPGVTGDVRPGDVSQFGDH
jgi:hypothetical protein